MQHYIVLETEDTGAPAIPGTIIRSFKPEVFSDLEEAELYADDWTDFYETKYGKAAYRPFTPFRLTAIGQ